MIKSDDYITKTGRAWSGFVINTSLLGRQQPTAQRQVNERHCWPRQEELDALAKLIPSVCVRSVKAPSHRFVPCGPLYAEHVVARNISMVTFPWRAPACSDKSNNTIHDRTNYVDNFLFLLLTMKVYFSSSSRQTPDQNKSFCISLHANQR